MAKDKSDKNEVKEATSGIILPPDGGSMVTMASLIGDIIREAEAAVPSGRGRKAPGGRTVHQPGGQAADITAVLEAAGSAGIRPSVAARAATALRRSRPSKCIGNVDVADSRAREHLESLLRKSEARKAVVDGTLRYFTV